MYGKPTITEMVCLTTDIEFKKGDKVRIIESSIYFKEQGMHGIGTINKIYSGFDIHVDFEDGYDNTYRSVDLEPAIIEDLNAKCIECSTPLMIKLSDRIVYDKFRRNQIPFRMCPACFDNWRMIRKNIREAKI